MRKLYVIFLACACFLISSAFTTQDDALKKSMDRGAAEYQGVCLACHMDKGQGIAGVFPPLANSDYLMADTERAIKSLIEGLQGEITVNGQKYNQVMPASGLDDQAIADVLNYVMNSWGNKSEKMVTKKQVAEVRASIK